MCNKFVMRTFSESYVTSMTFMLKIEVVLDCYTG